MWNWKSVENKNGEFVVVEHHAHCTVDGDEVHRDRVVKKVISPMLIVLEKINKHYPIKVVFRGVEEVRVGPCEKLVEQDDPALKKALGGLYNNFKRDPESFLGRRYIKHPHTPNPVLVE